jgi:hypothetical protein
LPSSFNKICISVEDLQTGIGLVGACSKRQRMLIEGYPRSMFHNVPENMS